MKDWDASESWMGMPQNTDEDPPEIDPAEVRPSGDATTDDTQATREAESRHYPERQSRSNRPKKLEDYLLD